MELMIIVIGKTCDFLAMFNTNLNYPSLERDCGRGVGRGRQVISVVLVGTYLRTSNCGTGSVEAANGLNIKHFPVH